MKTIEINTSFNVIIKFNLATVMDRAVAYFIDMAIIWSVIGLLSALFYGVITNPSQYLFLYIVTPIFGFYSLISEIIYNGQSLGKKAMKLRVIRMDGQRTKTSDYFMRWIFRLIDFYFSVYLLAVLTCSASQKGQRIGDVLADTVVVKVKESNTISLSALLNLNKLKELKPSFPEVIKLTESEMMIIKESLESFRKYPNKGYQEAIDMLVEHLEDVLQISNSGDNVEFLNALIKDYVMLTR